MAEQSGAEQSGAEQSGAAQTGAGPRVVAVGGGHGLAATLRAARSYAGELTAVVSVADDGGSTGRLRAEVDRPAPGDLRKCLVALAADGSLLARAMEHRFEGGDIEGHSFGNLLIVALSETGGDLVAALDEIGRLVGAVGRVLPTTSQPVDLRGAVRSGATVQGQVAVASHSDVMTVEVAPAGVEACGEAVRAIQQADQLVLGPGSLFTSVLAATAVDGIRRAIAESRGQLVYVCNLHPQRPETEGFGVADHVAALERHGIHPDVVLHDPDSMPGAEGVEQAVAARMARRDGRAHDPELLGRALRALLGS